MKEKLGKTRGFRPKPKNEERLNYAERLGINVSELINQVLEDNLKSYLERAVVEHRERISKLRETLDAPVP